MNMQESVLYIVLALLGIVIYLLLSQRKHKGDDKNKEEIDKLKEILNNSINTMSSSFNALSKDVTRDMTRALTKVDEKVGVFNQQVEAINKSQGQLQQNFGRGKAIRGSCRIFFSWPVKGFIAGSTIYCKRENET